MIGNGPRVPLVTIGGFLGSGKTTLVNKLLSRPDGRRIVVFVNDFGEINIDYDLIETVRDDRIALTNGCICCSIRDDLVRSISRVLREVEDIDVVIVEASGVSDPVSLSSSLRMLEDADLIRSELLTYLIDAWSFGKLDFEEREQAIEFAIQSDLVIINKCDLAPAERVRELTALLTEASPSCCIVETSHAQISLDFLLGQDRRRFFCLPGAGAASSHGFSTWSATASAPIDREAFAVFVQGIAPSCWRAKGIVWFTDAPDRPVVFNLVAGRATLEPLHGEARPALPGSLVAIGRDDLIDHEMMAASFRQMMAASSEGNPGHAQR